MSNELSERLFAALVRAPDWLRHHLLSKDEANRQRAVEALSAMIASALSEHAYS
ncbi:hypothetical protein [Rhizorhabdus sp.]|uniref:hypothetical protein n=1 Tax=Rhizorhabdus sp. TaxID=1968843 RepID=UPI0035B36DBD